MAPGALRAQGAPAASIAARAIDFLEALTPAQRTRALLAFPGDERENWHYVPRARAGLALRQMEQPQRRAARALLGAALSDAGLARVDGVVRLEGVLREAEGDWRDPDYYVLAVFGTPGTFPWGFRFEGHHLSLNFTLAGPESIAVTPAFFGANPANVRRGQHAGFRLWGAEEDHARAVLRGLDPRNRAAAVISDRSMGEIVAGPGREREIGAPRGVALGTLPAELKSRAAAIVDGFLGHLQADLAQRQTARIRQGGFDALRFAWAGGAEPGEAHYFRLHGPTTLVEHDNTQNGANHVHAVWRDLTADFGRDALADHYRTQRHGG